MAHSLLEQVLQNSAKDAETELIGNAWSAGKANGHPEEVFAKNPWSFKADKTFVTLRDGCHGSWSCRVDRDTVTLRMEWQDGQHGNWAEFSRQLGSLSSTFRSVGSSYDFMRSWSIEVGPKGKEESNSSAAAETEQWWHFETDSDLCGGDLCGDSCTDMDQVGRSRPPPNNVDTSARRPSVPTLWLPPSSMDFDVIGFSF